VETPAFWSADAASLTVGIVIFDPITMFAFSDMSFAAASERVVKLLEEAIDQRVSPG
jgi:hypothetical protein